jgi:hypothetical protein
MDTAKITSGVVEGFNGYQPDDVIESAHVKATGLSEGFGRAYPRRFGLGFFVTRDVLRALGNEFGEFGPTRHD